MVPEGYVQTFTVGQWPRNGPVIASRASLKIKGDRLHTPPASLLHSSVSSPLALLGVVGHLRWLLLSGKVLDYVLTPHTVCHCVSRLSTHHRH